MKKVIWMLLMAWAGMAWATQPADPPMATSSSYSHSSVNVQADVRLGAKAEGGAGGAATATGGAGGAAKSVATGGQAQGGDAKSAATGGQAQGGNATASAGSATAQAGSSSVQINSSGSRAAYAPDILATPTAPCRVAIGASAGWLGGALGFGGSVLDQGCHIRETARVLAGLGLLWAAVQAMCQDDTARKAIGAACDVGSQAPRGAEGKPLAPVVEYAAQ